MHALIRLDLHVAVRLARPTCVHVPVPSLLFCSLSLALFFSLLLLFLFFFPAGCTGNRCCAETMEILHSDIFAGFSTDKKLFHFPRFRHLFFAILSMKWQDSAASRLRQRQNRTFATRASAAAGGSAAAVAAAAMALGGGGGARGGGRGRRNRSRRRGEFASSGPEKINWVLASSNT